jgi:hypothetical protein
MKMQKDKSVKTKQSFKVLLVLFILLTHQAWGQKNIYENKQFKALTSNHQKIAILPFLASVQLDEVVPKENQKNLESSEGYAVQNALETYFLKIQKRKKYSVSFQNTKDTNAFLKKKNID